MSADKHTVDEIIPSLKDYGWEVRGESGRFVSGRFVSTAGDDEADLFCIRHGVGTYIEVKYFEGTGWHTSKWTMGQRKWLIEHHSAVAPAWLWLCGGKDKPHLSEQKYLPRRSWLIPAHIALRDVTLVECYQMTFPVRQIKLVAMREFNLCIEQRFRDFQLCWLGGSRWGLPESHLFRTVYQLQRIEDVGQKQVSENGGFSQ